jgi:DM4/DM12 family
MNVCLGVDGAGHEDLETPSIYTSFIQVVLINVGLGVDGAGCLLRAMCEVAAHPRHEDGLLGDAINMLLTAVQPHESG